MTIFDTVFVSVVAALISLKVILLVAAVVLFVTGLTARIQQRKHALRRASPGLPRLDLWA